MQAGLLRVLESKRIRRIGAQKEIEVDCRIVAATNQPLAQALEEGRFRSDLYYRLGVFTLNIPPLRERRKDIPVLTDHLMESFCKDNRIPPKRLTREALSFLIEHPLPGNGRQLRNVIASTLVCSEDPITVEDLSQNLGSGLHQPLEDTPSGSSNESFSDIGTMRDHERELILSALRKYRSVTRVCSKLGITRSTIYRRFRDLGIDQRRYLD